MLDLKELLFKLSITARQERKWATELQIAEIGYTRFPDDADWASRYATALLDVGDYVRAETILRQLDRKGPEQAAWLQIRLGRICHETGRFVEAEHHFRAALAAAPHTTVPWVFLGSFLRRSRRLQEACDLLSKGVNAEGDVDEIYLNLGLAKRAMNDLIGARDCFQKALSICPDYPDARDGLADVEEALRVRAALEQCIRELENEKH